MKSKVQFSGPKNDDDDVDLQLSRLCPCCSVLGSARRLFRDRRREASNKSTPPQGEQQINAAARRATNQRREAQLMVIASCPARLGPWAIPGQFCLGFLMAIAPRLARLGRGAIPGQFVFGFWPCLSGSCNFGSPVKRGGSARGDAEGMKRGWGCVIFARLQPTIRAPTV